MLADRRDREDQAASDQVQRVGNGFIITSAAKPLFGMIALAGIVTRDSIILVDFIELVVQRGRPLFDKAWTVAGYPAEKPKAPGRGTDTERS